MARPDDPSINRGGLDRYGIHEIEGPLMVGGVGFLTPSTGLFRDSYVRQMLSSKQRFEAYMQFREQAFKIFATELVSASKNPVDLVVFTDRDGQRFQNDYWFDYIMFRDNSHHFIVDDQSKESGVDNNSAPSVTAGDQSNLINDYKKNKGSILQKLHYTQRYFAYRKGLLKLDISQLNKDPKKAVEWLKSSTGWSDLLDEELRRGLKSHMDLLKEQEMGKMNQGSTSESEKVALERINVELSSALEKRLETSDWTARMNHYYNRTKLRNLARMCSIQAQETGVVLVKQALPVREICKEQILSTSPGLVKLPALRHTLKRSVEGFMKQTVTQPLEGLMKQTMEQSAKGYMGSLHRIHEKFGRGAARRMAWFSIIPLVTLATVGMSDKR